MSEMNIYTSKVAVLAEFYLSYRDLETINTTTTRRKI